MISALEPIAVAPPFTLEPAPFGEVGEVAIQDTLRYELTTSDQLRYRVTVTEVGDPEG